MIHDTTTNKRKVSVLFAVDEYRDIYRIARFTERIRNEERYCWSQIGKLACCAEQKDSNSILKKEEGYMDPISRWEPICYFRHQNGIEYQQVTDMLYRAGFKKQAKGLYLLEVSTDYNRNSETHELYYFTKGSLNCEFLFKKPTDNFLLPGTNTEFYACGQVKEGKREIHLRHHHEFSTKWNDWYVLDKGHPISKEFLLKKLQQQGCYATGSESFPPLRDFSFVGWTYADDEQFKLTPDGIHFLKVFNQN